MWWLVFCFAPRFILCLSPATLLCMDCSPRDLWWLVGSVSVRHWQEIWGWEERIEVLPPLPLGFSLVVAPSACAAPLGRHFFHSTVSPYSNNTMEPEAGVGLLIIAGLCASPSFVGSLNPANIFARNSFIQFTQLNPLRVPSVFRALPKGNVHLAHPEYRS